MLKNAVRMMIVTVMALMLAGCSGAQSSSTESDGAGGSSAAASQQEQVESTSSASSTISSAEESSSLADVQSRGAEQGSSAAQSQVLSSESSVDYSVATDKGIFDVTITLAHSYAQGVTQEDLDAAVAEKGYQSATLNEDGSVTYVMTRAQHAELMDATRASIEQSLSEIPGSEDYPNVTAVEHSDDFTNFSIITTSSDPSFKESLLSLALYVYGGMYSNFNGTHVDNIHVDFVNADSGEVVQSADSKNMGNSSEAPAE